ncbi:MAG: hypothetical protein LBC68_14915 [Prevotellaceae bacterium]|jgi:hypothetical protein|nr:hypothetical protein [Prevotellaceae bacterium]
MEDKIKSEGKCLFCGKTFAKAGINRHLQTHMSEKTTNSQTETSYLVKVETNPRWGKTPYFLSLWVDGSATMKNIDKFLRDIWLECCGHMSAFTNTKNSKKSNGMWDFFKATELIRQGKIKEYEKLMENAQGEIPMSRKVDKVFYKGLDLNYEYDFGSTTELLLTVVEEYSFKADKKIVLLSRNEPPELLCDTCKQEPAVQICTVHNWDEDSLFCSKCAKKHAKTCEDFADYAAMPVVNSPRMGVCGYEGGIIDKERDGVFVKKQ